MATAKSSKAKSVPKSATKNTSQKLRVTLTASPFGTGKRHIACVRGLGLRRIRDTRDLQDTPAVRGMITRVSYLVKAEEIV